MSELVGSVFVGIADIATDGIACARLLRGDVAVPNEGYKTAYTAVLAFGAVSTALSLAYRVRNARLVRAHALEVSNQGQKASASVVRQQAQQHKWELAQTHRAQVIFSLSLLSVAVQGASQP